MDIIEEARIYVHHDPESTSLGHETKHQDSSHPVWEQLWDYAGVHRGKSPDV